MKKWYINWRANRKLLKEAKKLLNQGERDLYSPLLRETILSLYDWEARL